MPFDASSYLRLEAPQCIGTSPAGATFATSSGDLFEVSTFGPGVFRLRLGPQTRPDYGLLAGKTKSCTVTVENRVHLVQSGAATLEISGTPLAFRLLHNALPVAGSSTDLTARGVARLPAFGRIRQGGQWLAALSLASGEPVYGLGEKYGPLDKRGQLLHSWVQDAMGVNTSLAHHEVPFAWSPGTGHGAWGVFVHTPGAVIHGIGHPDWSHRTYAIVVDDEALDLFLLAAESPAAILAQYTELTGHAAAVPAWSLGLAWDCGAHVTPDHAVQALADLRRRKIPCEMVMLEGGPLWEPQHRAGLEGERGANAAGPIARIGHEGARVCLRESPYVPAHSAGFDQLAAHGFLLRTARGMPYVVSGASMLAREHDQSNPGRAPDAALVDFANPSAYAWWRDAHAELFANGVTAMYSDGSAQVPEDALGFNGDRGVRLHNVYPLLHNRCIHEATEKLGPPQAAPIVFARGGWAAGQRAAVHLAAEAQNDWEALAACVRGALSLGMSGIPLHAMASPGTYGPEPPPELALRWLQASLFASHCIVRMRSPGEPWAFGAEAEAIARKWLAFRYRLVPYLAGAVEDAARFGLPVMRAMPFAFPGNALLRGYETQFLCGDALLVAPIVRPGGEVEIALPPGGWFDLNSRQRLAGQRVVRYRATLSQFPVFGREGHALPLGRPVLATGDIDAQRPLAQLWLFGKPAHPLAFAQARIARKGDTMRVEVAADVKVERFGDAAQYEVEQLG